MQSALQSVLRMEQLGNEAVPVANPVPISFPSGQRVGMRSGLAGEGEASAMWRRDKGAAKWVGRRSWVKSKAAAGVG